MTREEFMDYARTECNAVSSRLANRLMNVVERAWAEATHNAVATQHLINNAAAVDVREDVQTDVQADVQADVQTNSDEEDQLDILWLLTPSETSSTPETIGHAEA